MRHATSLLVLLSLLAGCNPPDGVLTWAFALQPPAWLEAPPGTEAHDFVMAAGRVQGDVGTRKVRVTVRGLPPAADGGSYVVQLAFAEQPIRAQGASPGPGGAAVREVELGTLALDALGSAELAGESEGLDLMAGARIEWMGSRRQTVLEGMVGNLDEPAPEAEPPTDTGHHH